MTTLYGFFHNRCIYESAAGLVSLHKTKKGAYVAMRKSKLECYQDNRDFSMLHHGKKWTSAYPPLKGQAFFIEPIELQE